MATTDFVQFATSNGSTVMTQANYLASPYLTTGVTIGLADPTLANKSWRQSATIGNVFTTYINLVTGQNCVDDGTTATILSNYGNSLRLATYVVDTSGSSNTLTASAAPAPTALVDGLSVNIKIANGNTGATTFNLNGLGAYSVITSSGTLVGNELQPGKVYTLTWLAATSKWFMTNYQITAPTQPNTDNSNNIATTAFIKSVLTTLQLVPAGTIITFAGTSAPSGYLACPTTQTNISRTTYAGLFAAIGTQWGLGDGSTTFGMPWFPAGYVALAGVSTQVGASTTGQNLAHTHTDSGHGHPGSNVNSQNNSTSTGGGGSGCTYGIAGSIATGYANIQSSGGTANLAAGTYVQYCVKT